MNSSDEVIITSDLSPNCSIWDPSTGNLLSTFKNISCTSKTLSLIGDDYFISGENNKPLVKVSSIQQNRSQDLSFALPGNVSAMDVSHCGIYCICGIGLDIYIYVVPTGELLSKIKHHMLPVTCVKFSSDGLLFISGSKDSNAAVWEFSKVTGTSDTPHNPLYTWANHNTEITDIHVGLLGFHSRVATVSRDMICNIYELSSGQHIVTFRMTESLTSVTMDSAAFFLMLGTASGNIHRLCLFDCNQREVRSDEGQDKCIFKGHTKQVCCLSVSFNGKKLLSGSDDCTCKIWNIKDCSLLMTLTHSGIISNAFFKFSPNLLVNKGQPQHIVRKFIREETSNIASEAFPIIVQEHTISSYNYLTDSMFTKCDTLKYKDISVPSIDIEDSNAIPKLQKAITINHQLYSYALDPVLSGGESEDDMDTNTV